MYVINYIAGLPIRLGSKLGGGKISRLTVGVHPVSCSVVTGSLSAVQAA